MRGATGCHDTCPVHKAISIHAPHAGSDMSWTMRMEEQRIFQSTLPMRGATCVGFEEAKETIISIHAPHAGSDRILFIRHFFDFRFQSTLPMRGATSVNKSVEMIKGFQSTLPMRGATYIPVRLPYSYKISIHAPHAGSDIIT